MIVDPLSTAVRLALLRYEPPNTKLILKNYHVELDPPRFLQPILRFSEGARKEDDVPLLRDIMTKATGRLDLTNPHIRYILGVAMQGLRLLQRETYVMSQQVKKHVDECIEHVTKRLSETQEAETSALVSSRNNTRHTTGATTTPPSSSPKTSQLQGLWSLSCPPPPSPLTLGAAATATATPGTMTTRRASSQQQQQHHLRRLIRSADDGTGGEMESLATLLANRSFDSTDMMMESKTRVDGNASSHAHVHVASNSSAPPPFVYVNGSDPWSVYFRHLWTAKQIQIVADLLREIEACYETGVKEEEQCWKQSVHKILNTKDSRVAHIVEEHLKSLRI